MKIEKQKLFIIGLLTLISSTSINALAESSESYRERCEYRYGREVCVREWHRSHSCLEEIWEALGTTVSAPECRISTPLARAITTKSYPLLSGNSFRVEYWQGAYEGTITETGRFRKKIYDTCHGRFVSDQTVTDTMKRRQPFAIENPNLSDSVDATYKLLPLVQEEAEAALAKAGADCLKIL